MKSINLNENFYFLLTPGVFLEYKCSEQNLIEYSTIFETKTNYVRGFIFFWNVLGILFFQKKCKQYIFGWSLTYEKMHIKSQKLNYINKFIENHKINLSEKRSYYQIILIPLKIIIHSVSDESWSKTMNIKDSHFH